jgi:hypothetical protein
MRLYISLRGCAQAERGGADLVFATEFLLIQALQGSVLLCFKHGPDETSATIDSQVSDRSVYCV